MKIKSKKIEQIYKSLEDNSFSEKDLHIMSKFEEEDLSELIELIDLNIIPIDILKYYFVVYDENIIAKLDNKIGCECVNFYLTKCWMDCIYNDSDENIIASLIGNSLFTSDLISRVRKGFLLEVHLIESFENKFESLVRAYSLEKQNNNLFFSLTGVDVSDAFLHNVESDFLETYYSISEKIEASILIYDYFDIFTNTFKYNDYLIKSSLETKDLAKNDLINKIKNHFNKKTNIDYMNNQQLNFYKTINKNKYIKNKILDKEFRDQRLGIDIEDLDLEDPKIVSEKKSFFKKDSNSISEQELKAIYHNKSIRSIKDKSSNRYYKIFVVLMCLIGVGGYVGILLSKSEAGEVENKAIASIIKEEKNNNQDIKND